MLKAIKIRIYPDNNQKVYIAKLLGSCRFVYNNCLAYKIEKYNNEKINVGFTNLGKYLTELKKKKEYSWLKESHSKVLQQTLINLEYAYKSFFKNGQGFPKFKSKHNNKQTCRFPVDAISKIYGNRINIILSLKNIRFKCSVTDEKYLNKNQDLIRSATLTRTKSGKYYFSILIDKNNNKQLLKTDKIIGIDLGIKDFIVASNNQCFENIKIKRNNQKKLTKLQRQLTKKQLIGTGEYRFNKYGKEVEINKSSNNRERARIRLAKFNEKLNNIKENYLHQITNQLLNENQVIVIEDLNVNGMLKNHNLAKSIQELSLNRFKEMLIYKANWYGREIIEIDRFYPSSKLCSNCGYKNNNLTLKDKSWVCPVCGVIHNRDLNAAINIKKEGERILSIKENKLNDKIGLSSPEYTLEDYPTKENRKILMDDKAVMPLKSSDRLIQEKK
jgi:putative transposase